MSIIHAMKRDRAVRLRPNKTCAFLSISTPKVDYVETRSPVKEGWLIFLALSFADTINEVDPGDWLQAGGRPISDKDATSIVAFAGLAAKAEDIVIHCDAGISRSVGAALALADAGFGTLKLWEVDNVLRANRLVYRKVAEVINRQRVPA